MANLDQIKKTKKNYEMMVGISAVIIVIAFISFFSNPFVAIFFFMGGGIAIAIILSKFKKISNEFKHHYVNETIQKLGIDATFEVKKGFSIDEVVSSGVIKKYDRFKSEDLIEGQISGKHFRFADVHIEDVRSNGKSTSVITMFRGRLFEIDYDKKINEQVYVFPNRKNYLPMFSGISKVELESIDFNNRFDVYCSNDHTVFYVLTPVVMEKIKELNDQYNKLAISFKPGKMYVAIDTRIDYFDISLFKALDTHFLDQIETDILVIKEIIKTLSL